MPLQPPPRSAARESGDDAGLEPAPVAGQPAVSLAGLDPRLAEVRLRIERDDTPRRISVRSADRVSFLKSPKLH